jgi:nucleolar protein 4
VVAGLPKDLTKNVLWKRVRKVNDAIELVFPVEGQEDTGRSRFSSPSIEADQVAHLIFPTHNDAQQSISKLHGHTYKGAVISAVLKKRLEKLSTAASHAGRLIVRNLAWDVSNLAPDS